MSKQPMDAESLEEFEQLMKEKYMFQPNTYENSLRLENDVKHFLWNMRRLGKLRNPHLQWAFSTEKFAFVFRQEDWW